MVMSLSVGSMEPKAGHVFLGREPGGQIQQKMGTTDEAAGLEGHDPKLCAVPLLYCGRIYHAPEGDLLDASHPGPSSTPQHVICTSDGAKVGVSLHFVSTPAFAQRESRWRK